MPSTDHVLFFILYGTVCVCSTWIVIILIIVACAVAVGEISARFIVGANRSGAEGFRALRAAKGQPLSLTPYFAIASGSL